LHLRHRGRIDEVGDATPDQLIVRVSPDPLQRSAVDVAEPISGDNADRIRGVVDQPAEPFPGQPVVDLLAFQPCHLRSALLAWV
jgi:hypothetical protein